MIRVIKKKKEREIPFSPIPMIICPNTKMDNQTSILGLKLFLWVILTRISKLNSCLKSTNKCCSNWCDSILKKLMLVLKHRRPLRQNSFYPCPCQKKKNIWLKMWDRSWGRKGCYLKSSLETSMSFSEDIYVNILDEFSVCVIKL